MLQSMDASARIPRSSLRWPDLLHSSRRRPGEGLSVPSGCVVPCLTVSKTQNPKEDYNGRTAAEVHDRRPRGIVGSMVRGTESPGEKCGRAESGIGG